MLNAQTTSHQVNIHVIGWQFSKLADILWSFQTVLTWGWTSHSARLLAFLGYTWCRRNSFGSVSKMRAALLARTGLAVLARFRKLPSPGHPCSTGVGYISHILELCWVLLGQRWVKVIISAAYGYYWSSFYVHHTVLSCVTIQKLLDWRDVCWFGHNMTPANLAGGSPVL